MKIDELPLENGWYWILIDGYETPTPCWFSLDINDKNDSYFLPGGMGDSSSMGLYVDDIIRVIERIVEPNVL